ncbi:hypothetical protein ACWIUD_05940 [Helicobacter sp. 23-1044]
MFVMLICHIERSEISQTLPLPCGGGLRGWVKIHHYKNSCKSQNLIKKICHCEIRRSRIVAIHTESSLRVLAKGKAKQSKSHDFKKQIKSMFQN